MSDFTSLHEHGVKYKICLPNKETDYIQKKIADTQKPYEASMLENMRSRVSVGDNVLDIGANVGNHTLYLAAVTKCNINAFEPNKQLCEALLRSCIENDLQDKVTVHEFAISSEPGLASFASINNENLGGQSIELVEQAGDEETFQVKVIDQLNLPEPIKLIKIDVEGFELEVLKGAKALIQRDQPYIYVESLTEDEFTSISNLLSEYGYSYWDTFNASPTHLYISNKKITLDNKINHIINKNIRELYSVQKDLAQLRNQLHECNLKYREVTQNASEWKLELSVLQTKYDLIEVEENKLVEERKQNQILEKELLRLNEQLREQKDDNESSLQTRSKLETANEKYKLACQSVDDLKESVSSIKNLLSLSNDELANTHEKLVIENETVESLKKQAEVLKLDVIVALKKEVETSERINQSLKNESAKDFEIAGLQHTLSTCKQERKIEYDLLLKESNSINNTNKELNEQAQLHNSEKETSQLLVDKLHQDSEILLKNHGSLNEQYQTSLIKLNETETVLSTKVEENAALQQEFSSLQRSFEENIEALQQIPALKEKWNNELEMRGTMQSELEQTKVKLKEANAENVLAKKRVLAIRSSNTFKAGYLLKKHIKSPIGWVKLPVGLWRLHKQSRVKSQQVIKHVSHEPALTVEKSQQNLPKPSFQSIELHSNASEIDKLYLNGEDKNSTLKVACIMDEFTYQSYLPECELHQLTPANWLAELESFKPEMLFIESAWRGKDELWGSKVGHQAEEVKNIIKWCNAHNVPTAFWNKEDPIHFETFLNTAKLFDHIFTTDIDCIQRYKAALKHDYVYFLPFACQPLTNNPIEKYQRKNAISFAGAYYVKYPERTKDLESLVAELPKFKALEIYDRNYGKSDSNYQFPEVYNPYIVGTLPFEEIDKAYKGYDYAINLNSIKQSQTMFARRVYELLASNTITISNFSQGVRLLFGDLVITTDDGKEVVSRLQKMEETEHGVERLKLAALRKVISEHTYQDRLNYIQEKVLDIEIQQKLPSIGIVSKIKNSAQFNNLLKNVLKQQGVQQELLIVVTNQKLKHKVERELKAVSIPVSVMLNKELNKLQLSELFSASCWLTYFSCYDCFGNNYLQDLVLATRYSAAQVIGKINVFQWNKGRLVEPKQFNHYQHAKQLRPRSAIISPVLLNDLDAKSWLENVNESTYQFAKQLVVDPYNYCLNNNISLLTEHEELFVGQSVFDLPLNCGMPLAELVTEAESIQPTQSKADVVFDIKGEEFLEKLKLKNGKQITLNSVQGGLQVHSVLADTKHDYLYAHQDFARTEFSSVEENSKLPLHFDIEPGLNISIVLLYLDENKQRISHNILQANRNHTIELPYETEFIRFGLRVLSSGEAKIKSLIFGHKDLQPEKVFGQSDVLILTNHYPSYDDLYRNGFVHSRAKAYQTENVNVDVFRLRQGEPISWHEYQNINVITGAQAALRKMLGSGQYRHVLVHFLDAQMWEVLLEYIDTIKVTVWVHGAEVQPWWRRKYNYTTPEELEVAKGESEIRIAFWQDLTKQLNENVQFVFVSKYFAEEVMGDIEYRFAENQYTVIHNPIDTEIFNYVKKDVSQRKKILSIRPYASAKYANDLSVKAILELSKKPYFSELEFKMIGDGKLFDEILEPLRKFDNVIIQRGFLKQNEIADLHKEYGVFLTPTRMDAQGVSRDEAMASGLVPVTNAVAAIPEFVDGKCGILAPKNDYLEMAKGIEEIVNSTEKFTVMSENCSQRVKAQTSARLIINAELVLFNEI